MTLKLTKKTFTFLFVVSTILCFTDKAYAIFGSGFNARNYSLSSVQKCKKLTGLSAAECIFFDPPGTLGVLEIGFEVEYDSSKLEIIPELSGFLCDFSSDGDCPSTSENIEEEVILGDPREGTSFDLIVTNNKVIFNYDLSNNPTPPIEGETFFFGLAYKKLIPSTVLIPTTKANIGDIFQVESGNFCVTIDELNNCGSENPTFGFSVVKVPEPSFQPNLLKTFILGISLLFLKNWHTNTKN